MSWISRGGLNAWRNHPMLRPNSVWECLPGLKKALVVFGAYCVVDFGYNAIASKKSGGHHEGDHHGGNDHHDDHHHSSSEVNWTKSVSAGRPVSTSARTDFVYSTAHFQVPTAWFQEEGEESRD